MRCISTRFHRTRRLLLCLLPALFLLSLLPATLAASTGENDGQLVQFDYWGFSIAPDPVAPGDKLELVGAVNEGTTVVPLSLDFAGNEYTVYVTAVLDQVILNGPLLELHYTGAVGEIWEDPSFNAPFHANTDPSQVPDLEPGKVPENFRDGTLLVRYRFRDFVALYYAPAGLGTVAYTTTELRAIGGSAYGDLQQLHMIIGWHMGGGYTNDPGAAIPAGYGMRYDTLFRWENPLPVAPATWGGIKSTFR